MVNISALIFFILLFTRWVFKNNFKRPRGCLLFCHLVKISEGKGEGLTQGLSSHELKIFLRFRKQGH